MTMPPLRSDADAKAKDEKIRDDEIEDSNTDAQDLDDFVQGFRDGERYTDVDNRVWI